MAGQIPIDILLKQVASYQTSHVMVTGGKTLTQKIYLLLLTALCDAWYQVSLEKSGAIDLSTVNPRKSNGL